MLLFNKDLGNLSHVAGVTLTPKSPAAVFNPVS
jgi:hypothetical protein